MTVKSRVLAALKANRDKDISGESLAETLDVSRNAVWKAVRSLRESGYTITAATNRGYRLTYEPDHLTAAGLKAHITHPEKWQIRIFESLPSTNTTLKEMAFQGAPEGTIIIAEEQTAGRGRMNRTFYSPSGTGVYMSILLRPTFSASQSLLITTAAAVAVAESIEEVTGLDAAIKWVNDIYLNDRKTCGILTEASFNMETSRLAYAVLGIGINMRTPAGGFPGELKPIVTSVFENCVYSPEKRDRIVAGIINRFGGFYENLTNKSFIDGYRNRSWLKGKEVNVISGDNRVPATAGDIDDDFRLQVRYPDGTEEFIGSGEVSVKPRS